jgi:3' exoribonuclease, RNase T-like
MLYFLDTEFIEGERTVDLVSIAVVADDKREFYAISTDFDPERANTFVQRSVLPLLEPRGHPAWKSRHRILDELVAFVGADRQPVFWTWGGSAYDWWATVQLFPLARRVPDGWKYSAYDVMQLAEEAGLATDPIDPRLPIPPADAHHALADARWTRAVYHFLRPAKGPIGS